MATIDLSKLPAPQLIQTLSSEDELQALKEKLLAHYPEGEDRDQLEMLLSIESEPLVKFMEETAYLVTLLKGRINSTALGMMLAFANGADLDHLAARTPVERKVISPGDPDATPPVPAVMESDEEFRARVQLAPAGFSVAGPLSAYRFFALGAHPDIKDARAKRPTKGEILITVLSRLGDGVPSAEALAAVDAACSDEDTRPVNDDVTVQPATIIGYSVTACMVVRAGPDSEIIRAAGEDAVLAFAAKNHVIGRSITRAALSGELYVAGGSGNVVDVILDAPVADLVITDEQAPYLENLTITVEVEGA